MVVELYTLPVAAPGTALGVPGLSSFPLAVNRMPYVMPEAAFVCDTGIAFTESPYRARPPVVAQGRRESLA